MMMTKIPAGRSGLSNRSGSCGGLVEYLEKEQAGLWFDAQREDLAGHEVVAGIDGNKRNLGRADAKYYQVILAPSQAELAHIGSDPVTLQTFTRSAMEQYAANFGRGIGSHDLVWFAKLEHSRHFDHTDREVQLGEQERGEIKPGDQTHIHVVVSRTENLRVYAEGKKKGRHERKNPYHLSPLTNHIATMKGPVVGGFERNGFSQRSEQVFDQTFGYDRPVTESFLFLHGMKYGEESTKVALQQAAIADRQQRAARHEPVAQPANLVAEKNRADALRQGLGQAYQQQDLRRLRTALSLIQAEQDRVAQQQKLAEQQQQQQQRQQQQQQQRQALEASRLAEQRQAPMPPPPTIKEQLKQDTPAIRRGPKR